MKHTLLLSGVIAALAISAPAHSQYIYMDANNDVVCTSSDVLTSSSTSVDVYLNTNHNAAGGVATCSNPAQPLDMTSYDILIHAAGSGSVTYSGWTNNMPNYSVFSAFTTAGADMGVGFQAPFGSSSPPGLYKLGSIAVTVTGSPRLSFLTSPPRPAFPSPY